MAARYWVGGTGTWNGSNTTNWSATNGGTGGASVPGTADTVFFTSLSGSGIVTWGGASSTVISIDSTGFIGTHAAGTNNKTLTGTNTVWFSPATCTITGTPTLTVNSTGSTAISVTCDHLAPSTTNAPAFNFTGGTYALNLSGAGFRTLSFSGSSCIASGSVSLYGNMTLANGTYTGLNPIFLASATIVPNGKTIGNFGINGTGITVTLSGALTVGAANTTTLTAGTLALSNFTFNTGIFNSSFLNTRAISFGTGNIVLTSTTAGTTVLGMPNVTNFTYTGTGGFVRNQGATATVTFGTNGGSASNAPNLTVNAGASALTVTTGSYFKNLNFTGSSSTVTGIYNAVGNLTLGVGTYTSLGFTFRASGTIISNGKTLGAPTINAAGFTVTLGDAFATGSTLTITQGTFNAANFNVTALILNTSNTNTRAISMGSGTWTLTGSGTIIWNISTTTGLTLTPSTSTINMTSGSAKTFVGGNLTYYNLNQGGLGALTISGSNTFNNITNTTQPATVTFTAGTTQTVSNFGLSGTAGNLITINSSASGSQFTLSDSSGVINAQYLSVQDSNVTGGATWNALYSTNISNNTGWNFLVIGGNMFLMF